MCDVKSFSGTTESLRTPFSDKCAGMSAEGVRFENRLVSLRFDADSIFGQDRLEGSALYQEWTIREHRQSRSNAFARRKQPPAYCRVQVPGSLHHDRDRN